jgi:hypothetical protein
VVRFIEVCRQSSASQVDGLGKELTIFMGLEDLLGSVGSGARQKGE